MSVPKGLKFLAERKLAERAVGASEGLQLDADRRVPRLEQNLVGCMTVDQMRAVTSQVGGGAGGELKSRKGRRPNLHSTFSSAALAINSFACWIGNERSLMLDGREGFERLEFESRCPVLPPPATPPNLDLIAFGSHPVAVESKCTEHLGSKIATVDSRYQSVVKSMHPSWRKAYDELEHERALGWGKRRYRHLDVLQLIKHYLGLKERFKESTITLLYLYWEPADPEELEPLMRHRREVDYLSDRVADPEVRFAAFSYRALWNAWIAKGQPRWLYDHVENLKTRYDVVLSN